ncbi:MAG TPA: type IV secretion system protein [Luteibacter sp.]|jgi:type IV secretion system protein VirB6|nr:type IV secretion system protein [Luteibacter sp.]
MAIEIAKLLIGNIAETIRTFADDHSSLMIDIIGPAAVSLLSIYVVLWGAGIASGRINEPFASGAYRIIRICVIIIFALTASSYKEYVSDFFLTAPSEIAAKMAGAADGQSLADVIDACLNRGIGLGDKVWDYASAKFGLFHFGYIVYFFLAIVIYLAVCIIVAIATGMIFVAWVATAILVAVGPLFILLAIFQTTQRFFEQWLGQLVNFAVLFILVATTVTLCFDIFEKFISDLPSMGAGEAVISMIKVVVATFAIVSVLLQTKSISSGLAGGISLAAQNLGSAAMGKMRSAAGAAAPVASAMSRAASGGAATLARAAKGAGGAANSIASPRARMSANKGDVARR